MRHAHFFMALALVGVSGCPTREKSTVDSGANAGMGGQQVDSGSTGTGGQSMDAMDALTPTPTLRIVSPSATAYTKGTIQVQVEVANATPATVTLLADGSPIATISPPFL